MLAAALRGISRALTLALLLASAAILAAAGPALSLEQRQVGAYQVVIGWRDDPAYADVGNAVRVVVFDSSSRPVDGAGQDLRVELVQGSRRSAALPLEPAQGTPGEYRAEVIPTDAGAYTFHLAGSIRGQRVDESFSGSGAVRAAGQIQFPGPASPSAPGPAAGQQPSVVETALLAAATILLCLIGLAALIFVPYLRHATRGVDPRTQNEGMDAPPSSTTPPPRSAPSADPPPGAGGDWLWRWDGSSWIAVMPVATSDPTPPPPSPAPDAAPPPDASTVPPPVADPMPPSPPARRKLNPALFAIWSLLTLVAVGGLAGLLWLQGQLGGPSDQYNGQRVVGFVIGLGIAGFFAFLFWRETKPVGRKS